MWTYMSKEMEKANNIENYIFHIYPPNKSETISFFKSQNN